MPQNLGLYNENLSVPRKQDVDAVQEQVNNLSETIGDFVTAQDPSGIVDTVPPTFGGYTVQDFVLKSEVVNNLTSVDTNLPLSANQGNILNQNIQQNSSSINTLNNNIDTINSSLNNKLNITGGTLTGILIAQSNTNYTTGQVRNIYLSTEAPTDDVGNNGDIWIVYGGGA